MKSSIKSFLRTLPVKKVFLSYHYKISLVVFLSSIIYFLALPFPPLSRSTYISENALMLDYGKSQYKDEFKEDFLSYAERISYCLKKKDSSCDMESLLLSILGELSSTPIVGDKYTYSVMKGKRSDGNESLLLMAPYSVGGKTNVCGISMLLASIKQFRNFNYWSRDILVLIAGNSAFSPLEGVNSFLSSYHNSDVITSSSAIQAAISLEVSDCSPQGNCDINANNGWNVVELLIEGRNGLLPNLDLVNSFCIQEVNRSPYGPIDLGRGGEEIRVFIKKLIYKIFSFLSRWKLLPTLNPNELYNYIFDVVQAALFIKRQGLDLEGYSHGPMMAYRIDAVTLSLRGDPSKVINEQDEMSSVHAVFNTDFDLINDEDDLESVRREIYAPSYFKTDSNAMKIIFDRLEMTMRSLNNILEHLHQSFFIYILLGNGKRFVSIANYIAIGLIPIILLSIKSLYLYLCIRDGNSEWFKSIIGVLAFITSFDVIYSALRSISILNGFYTCALLFCLLLVFKSFFLPSFSLRKIQITSLLLLCILLMSLLLINFGFVALFGFVIVPFLCLIDFSFKFVLLIPILVFTTVVKEDVYWNFGVSNFLILPTLCLLLLL